MFFSSALLTNIFSPTLYLPGSQHTSPYACVYIHTQSPIPYGTFLCIRLVQMCSLTSSRLSVLLFSRCKYGICAEVLKAPICIYLLVRVCIFPYASGQKSVPGSWLQPLLIEINNFLKRDYESTVAVALIDKVSSKWLNAQSEESDTVSLTKLLHN